VLREQGVTLGELVPLTERRAAAEATIAEALARRLVKKEQAAVLLDRLNRGNREMASSATGAATATSGQAAATEELSTGLRDLAVEQRSAARENDAYARSARSAANAQAAFNATVGRVTARDPRQQGFVDAAVTAGMTPILGGTRIRGARGGSRLILGGRSF